MFAAVKTARQWLFRPGTLNGEPVPVLIKLELSFHLTATPPAPVPLGAQSSQQVQPPVGFRAVGASPIVTLISTGTEPRKPLRFVIANGHREHMTVDTTMAITVTTGDNSMPEMKLPLLRIGVDLAVTAVSNAGDMTILTTLTDVSWIPTPDSGPATLTRLNSTAAGLKGLSGTTLMSDRQVIRDVKFDTSKISDPQLSETIAMVLQTMQNQSLPLPEEPVGVGATWEVRLSLKAYGLQTFNKYSVQLAAMDDKSCTLKVALDQTAPPQSISNPALAGATASIDALNSTGNGSTTIQFDTLAPTGEVSVSGKTTMHIDIGGNRRQMNTVMSMKLRVTPGDVKAVVGTRISGAEMAGAQVTMPPEKLVVDFGIDYFGPAPRPAGGMANGPGIKLVNRFKQFWSVPADLENASGHIVAAITLDEHGVVSDISIVEPSPIAALNTAVMNALSHLNPTPLLPQELPTATTSLPITIFWNELTANLTPLRIGAHGRNREALGLRGRRSMGLSAVFAESTSSQRGSSVVAGKGEIRPSARSSISRPKQFAGYHR